MSDAHGGCALCHSTGGVLVATGRRWRVIRAEDPAFPAFYRVVWAEHVAEFSSLPVSARAECMSVVCAVEQVLLRVLRPTKVNLAALGNVVPHLHWHVIARFDWDSHFPQPIWGEAQRHVDSAAALLGVTLPDLDREVALAVGELSRED
ncbi:MAG: HIT domain-containing protein [Burkholderiales bacterium 28-67-8]|nr:MAG: HIT domain-containing protein [Burkholderiales bacterium 28-67-8]